MPGRSGGFYPQGRGFSSVFFFPAASAVSFFNPVDAHSRFSPRYVFLCSCCSIKRAACSEHALAIYVVVSCLFEGIALVFWCFIKI